MKWNSRALHFCLFFGVLYSFLKYKNHLGDDAYVWLMTTNTVGYLLTNAGKDIIRRAIDVLPSTKFGK